MARKLINDLVGKSWDEVRQNIPKILQLDEESGDAKAPGNSFVSTNLNQHCDVPENLAYLFGRYPVLDDSYSVTKCNYCERILSSNYIEKHVEECDKIPQVLKDELHVLTYGTKPKSASSGKKNSSSGAGIKIRLPIPATLTRPPKQSSPSTEPHLLQPSKPSHPVNLPSRTCSSAPPSPTGSSLNTQPIVTPSAGAPPNTNYSFPSIKIEKSDSPGGSPFDGKTKPNPSAVPSISLKTKKTSAPSQTPKSLKIKPSVVLKIKGNTSTTTTSAAGRITLHAAPSEPPSPAPAGDANQNVSSPKAPLPLSLVHIPQGNRGLDESFLPSVVASLGSAPPRIGIKPLDTLTDGSVKKKRPRHDARKVIPLRDRSFNPNEHCGVVGPDGSQCKRSLTCKTHSMGLRRAVSGRSQPFDVLISTQKQARDKAKLAKKDSSSSPTSPIMVPSSPLVSCSLSSGDGSSDASRLSIPVPTPPATTPSITIAIPLPRNSPAPHTVMTLQSLLNSGIQIADATGPLFTPSSLKSDVKFTTISIPSPKVVAAPQLHPPQKKKVKKLWGTTDTSGIKLQLVTKEPEGFDCVTQIIPPEEEVIITSEDSTVIDPMSFFIGKILVKDSAGNIFFEKIPLTAIPVGRRKMSKPRPSGPSSNFVGSFEEKLPTMKKPRREMNVSTERILLGDRSGVPASHTLTLTRAEESEGPVPPSPQTQPQKICFKLDARLKKICRPHHAGWRQDGMAHVGPLTERTGVLNGLATPLIDYGGGSQPLTSFEPMEVSDDGKRESMSQPMSLSLQHNSKPYEGNGQNWMGVEGNRSVDAPVADSELNKLLAAQFEDY